MSSSASDSRAAAAREIVRVCRRLYERGLVAGQDGNVSIRLRSGTVLVTPAGASKVDVAEDDLVEVSLTGEHVAGARGATSELGMHLGIYAVRPDVAAIVHAHPPLATGMTLAGLDFTADVLPETIFHLGRVPLVPYAQPGTPMLARALEPFIAGHDAFLLAHHGATTVGPTLLLAHQRMESLEHGARILAAAHTFGRVNELPAGAGNALHAARDAKRHEQSGGMSGER